jgi:CTP synthase
MLIRTLNPYEHGECYVTDDGAETDLDLGTMNVSWMLLLKQIMLLQEEFIFRLLKREKRRVLGKTVQVVPHITNEIKDRMQLVILAIMILL